MPGASITSNLSELPPIINLKTVQGKRSATDTHAPVVGAWQKAISALYWPPHAQSSSFYQQATRR